MKDAEQPLERKKVALTPIGYLNLTHACYLPGFQSIRDSLEALKQIQTTKLKLEKEKFKQDMKKIRQKITELHED